MARRIPILTESPAIHQTGIRQRSLRGHCRLGRATELVFVLAMGATMVLSGGSVQAQVLWSGVDSADWTDDGNWIGIVAPDVDDTAEINGNGDNAPFILEADSVEVEQTNVIAGTLTIEGTLNSPVDIFSAGEIVVSETGEIVGAVTNAGDGSNAGIIASLGNSGTFTNTGTITGNAENSDTLNHNAGTIGGTLTNSDGTTTVADGAVVTGLTTIIDGEVNNSGTLADVNNEADGNFVNTADGTAGDVTNAGTGSNAGTIASLDNLADGTFTNTGDINGDADNSGTFNHDGGTIGGTLTNEADGLVIVGAGATLQAATIENEFDGTIQVQADATLQSTGNTINNAGLLNVGTNGTVESTTSNVNNLVTGVINFNGPGGTATLAADGEINNDGTINLFNGGLDVTGDFTNQGTGTVSLAGGDVTFDSDVTNTDTASFTIASGTTTIDGGDGTFNNEDSAALTINAGATLNAALENAATANIDGTLDGTLTNTDGTTTVAAGASVTGTTTITGGTVDNSGTLADVDNQVGGTFNNLLGAAADAVTNAGTGSNASTIASLDNLLGGAFTNTGTISGNAANAGTLDHDAGNIGGTLTNTDGTTTVAAGASVTGTTTITGGTVDNSGTLADVDNQVGGTFNNLLGAAADAVTNAGTGTNAGTIASLDNLADGTFTNTGTISGNAANAGTLDHDAGNIGGTLTNTDGTTTVAAGASVTGTTTITGGTVDNSGTLADVDNQVGGTFNNLLGAAADAVTNAGTGTNAGTIASLDNLADGTFTNTGTISGNAINSGTFNAAGTITGSVTNNATMTVTGNLGGITTLTNNELLTLSAGTTTTAANFFNDGNIVAQGPVTLVGNLDNAAGSTISTVTGVSGETFTVNGNVSGTTTLALDVALGTVDAGTSDRFVVTGSIGGTMNVDFNNINTSAALQSNRIVFAEAASFEPGFELTGVSGLPGGLLDVVITQEPTDLGFQILPNTSLGGVAGTLGSVQAIIGSVVNRPSSPFVSRVLFEPEGGCSQGGWARGIFGRATSDTTTAFGGSSVVVPSTSELRYRGVQGGFDISCIDDGPGGLEYAVGVSFGQNTGSTSQNRFAFDPLTGTLDPDAPLSPITGSFTQRYGAIYVVAERDNWAGDLQLRREHTSLTFNNADLELDNATISTRGTTLSGSLTYFHSLDEGITLAPTAGFALTRTGAGALTFGDPAAPTATLLADSHTSKVGFVGMSLARSDVNEAAQSATTSFVTATMYNDFAKARTTRFGLGDGSGDTTTLSTRNLGAFGEVSVGMSYVKLFNGGAGAPRQFTATVRGDARFSGRLESYGLTAQMRLNF